jgi:hypothetical protein
MDYTKITLLKNRNRVPIKQMAAILEVTVSGYYYIINNQTLTVKQLVSLANYFKVPITHFFPNEQNITVVNEKQAKYGTKCENCESYRLEIDILTRQIKEKEQSIAELNREIGRLMSR